MTLNAPRRRVSAVVTFHRERELVTPTLHAIERMRQFAEARGLEVRLVMTLDGDDVATRAAVRSHPALRADDVLHEVDFHDLSLCRNFAIAHADGDYVATLDGDDLFSENWISAAVDCIATNGPQTICHPHLLVAFGGWQAFWYQIDQTSEQFKPATLMALNHWNACSVALRRVFLHCPYAVARVGASGFGFEDWHWNCETIAHGYVHRVVPHTFRLERRKLEGSLNVAHQQHAATLRPSRFFDIL